MIKCINTSIIYSQTGKETAIDRKEQKLIMPLVVTLKLYMEFLIFLYLCL